eukprot:15333302-Ditylum_brightwellii.AAC.1
MSGSPSFNGDSGLSSRTKGDGHTTPIGGVSLASTHFVRNGTHLDGEGSTYYDVDVSTRNVGGGVKKSFGKEKKPRDGAGSGKQRGIGDDVLYRIGVVVCGQSSPSSNKMNILRLQHLCAVCRVMACKIKIIVMLMLKTMLII